MKITAAKKRLCLHSRNISNYDPFLLLKNNFHSTMFEVIFLKDEYYYRYGFRYNLERIVGEL